MSPEEKAEKFFDVMEKLPWINSERYRNGIMTFISECNSVPEIELINHVLTNLKFCTSNDVANSAFQIANVIQDQWNLLPEDTLFVGLAEPNKTCGSTAFIRAIEISLPRIWATKMHPTFVSAFRLKDANKNLILVDDFIGTGEKLETKIKRIKDNPKTSDYKLFVVTFAGMESGIGLISGIVNANIYSHIQLNKCLTSILPIEKSNQFKNEMLKLERPLFNHQQNLYSLGYRQSEAAFYLEATNIPNNNFPILWWDEYANGSTRHTLFARR